MTAGDPEAATIDALVRYYQSEDVQWAVSTFRDNLLAACVNSKHLVAQLHSWKSRLKDAGHLHDKLRRKLQQCQVENKPFPYTRENLLAKINDLIGLRLIHLHTSQFSSINTELLAILRAQKYQVIEGPTAKTWDQEYEGYFLEQGVATEDSKSLYTSVHYVVSSNSAVQVTAEIQVRTLSEELWGEVDHSINYPHKLGSVACREQIKVLARITSSATRLVDSIFRSLEEHRELTTNADAPSGLTSTTDAPRGLTTTAHRVEEKREQPKLSTEPGMASKRQRPRRAPKSRSRD